MARPILATATDDAVRENARLAALDSYDVLDTPPEEAFDRITRLTRQIFGVAMSSVTFIDGHRQWFKSRQGLPVTETPRAPAFCNFTIQQNDPLVIQDMLQDSRFQNSDFVRGAPHIRFYAGVQLRAQDGNCIGTFCAMDTKPHTFDHDQLSMFSDLASIVMSELELRKLAMHDSLTGALSRRAFREDAARAIALAVRHKHDLSCVIFDLDHFKSINDNHGHAVGDLVLKACTEVCRQELRDSDIVGRIGGEEFAILLPYTGREATMAVVEKVRAAVARIYVPSPSGALKVSASFGIALLDPSVTDIDELLRRADDALYQAKHTGRNRCAVWTPAGPARSNTLRRVFMAGYITFDAGRSKINCTIRGLSDTGATLHVNSSADIPDSFRLQIAPDATDRACRIVTKSDKRLEVMFE